MATRGATEFTANGVDYTINDPNNAEEFKPNKDYYVRDHVYYQGQLCVFMEDHPAGAWNPSHVMAIKVGQELANLWNANNESKSDMNAISPILAYNLIDTLEIGDIYQGGNVPGSTTLRMPDRIPIKKNTKYVFCSVGRTNKDLSVGTVYWYTDSGWLSYDTVYNYTPFTSPQNATRMRFVVGSWYGTTYNKDIAIVEMDKLKTLIDKQLNLPVEFTLTQGTFQSDGEITSTDTRLVTNYIPLNKGATVDINCISFQYMYGYFDKLTRNTWVMSDGWDTAKVKITLPYDCLFVIKFRKSNDAQVEPSDFTDTITINNPYINLLKDIGTGSFISPETFEGTDTQKLQSAVNALTNKGGTILITRPFALQGNIIISNNSNYDTLIRFVGFGNASIDFGNYHMKGDSVEHGGAYGGISIENIRCYSTSNNGSMIDGDTLIRIYIKNCIISGFKDVVISGTSYFQTIYIESCLIRHISRAVIYAANNKPRTYDVKIMNCAIEWCKCLLNICKARGVTVVNNMIEGFTGTPFVFRDSLHRVLIDGNYFENNGIDLGYIEGGYDSPYHDVTDDAFLMSLVGTENDETGTAEISLTFSNNFIDQTSSYQEEDSKIYKDIVLPANEICGQISIHDNHVAGGSMLVYGEKESKYENVLYYANVTHEKEFDEQQYDCENYVTVITAAKINALFNT